MPPSTKNDDAITAPPRKPTQNDSMLSFGNAMSRAPIIRGIRKFPNAPVRIGMITAKIMIEACMVNTAL